MSDQIRSHLSQRACDLLVMKKKVLNSSGHSDIHWAIEYSGRSAQIQTDRILTLRYGHSTGNELTDLFLESLCRLSEGKMVQAVFALSFREVENFLRDENHLPAFTETIEDEAREAFFRVKSTLASAILLENVDVLKELGVESSWSELNLSGKNRTLLALFSWLNNRLGQTHSLDLILAEENTVTVKNNDFPLELPLVESFLNQIFRTEGTQSPLKVIGTL